MQKQKAEISSTRFLIQPYEVIKNLYGAVVFIFMAHFQESLYEPQNFYFEIFNFVELLSQYQLV